MLNNLGVYQDKLVQKKLLGCWHKLLCNLAAMWASVLGQIYAVTEILVLEPILDA